MENFLTKKQQKILATLLCFLADLFICLFFYFKGTQYTRFLSTVGDSINSPEFQLQLYKILLKTATFSMMLFLIFQLIVYTLMWKNLRSAKLYLKYYAVTGSAIAMAITLFITPFGLVPAIIYIFGYYVFASIIPKHELKTVDQTPQTPQ